MSTRRYGRNFGVRLASENPGKTTESHSREQDRHCAGRPVGKSSDLVSIATVIRGSTTGGRGRMAVGGNKLEQNGEILGSNGFLYPKLKVHVIGEIGTGPVLGIRHGTGGPPACDLAHETTAMRFAEKSSDRATETRAGRIVLGKSIDQLEQTQTTWFGQGLLTTAVNILRLAALVAF